MQPVAEGAHETVSSRLSDAQIEQFARDGYLVVRGLFTSGEMDELRETFMAQAADGPVEGLSDSHRKLNPDEPLARFPRMMHPHTHPELSVGPVSLRYMLDGRVGAVLRALFAEEPLAVQSMFYFKPAGARGQDLHQDNFYLRVKPGTCMAAWVAVDDADEGNGGLVVVPGSNQLDIACPERADASQFFTTEHVPVPAGLHEMPVNLQAGDVLFFNGNLIHGSYPNTSRDRFRRAFICHYVPRSTSELAHWYRTPLTFDRERVSIAEAMGGGPCGTVQPMGAPH